MTKKINQSTKLISTVQICRKQIRGNVNTNTKYRKNTNSEQH